MKLTFDLSNPHFTLLHRAGLAGLWMTLNQLKKETQLSNSEALLGSANRLGQLDWQLTPRQVTLHWEGNDLEVLNWLLKESFQLEDGRIILRGLDSKTMPIQSQLILHKGILGTFLQHNKTHKSAGNVSKSFQVEEDKPEFVANYKSLTWYVYQDFAKNLCESSGQLLTTPIKVLGWLNPGAVVRHVAFSSDTSFEEPPAAAFLLLFASVACCYNIIKSKLRDQRAQYALVVPEVTDLEAYAKWRQNPKWREEGYKDFFASGLGDAGLKFLTHVTEVTARRNVQHCQVLTLGTVAWSAQQKTRTDLYVIEANDRICQNYQTCKSWLGDRVVAGKDGAFVVTSFARELIAENLAKSKPWYSGFADKVNSNDLFRNLTYERGGLNQMLNDIEWDKDSEKLFVKACHEAIGYTHKELYKRAKDKGEVANYEREDTKFRTGLTRCKTPGAFREFITDYLSRTRFLPTLEENWEQLMDLIMGAKDWKKGRDLALLALASYKRSRKEKVATDESGESDEIDFDI